MGNVSQRPFKSDFTWSLSARQRRILFFRDNAGYCVGSCILGAAQLADAELAAEEASIRFEWHYDDDADWSWLPENDSQTHEPFYCVALDETGACLASLHGIFDPTPDYRRVVEAELAMEALLTLAGYAEAADAFESAIDF